MKPRSCNCSSCHIITLQLLVRWIYWVLVTWLHEYTYHRWICPGSQRSYIVWWSMHALTYSSYIKSTSTSCDYDCILMLECKALHHGLQVLKLCYVYGWFIASCRHIFWQKIILCQLNKNMHMHIMYACAYAPLTY